MIDLIAISVLLAACGALLLWDHMADRQRDAVSLRLKAIHDGEQGDTSTSAAAVLQPLLFRLGNLERHFEALGWQYSRRKMTHVVAAIAVIFIAQSFTLGALAGLLLTLAELAAAFFAVKAMARRKGTNFVDEFPDFVDRIRQLVIAGNSVTTAFDKGLHYCSPLQLRFLQPVSTMVAHGAPLYDALHQRALRLDIPELYLFTAIVRTNMRFGGDLSSSLSHFEKTLTNRLRAQKEFKAMTSELRMTTLILMALPFVAGIGIFLLNPRYLDFFVKAPQGLPAAIYICLSILFGLYFIKKLTNVEY
jgi:tight adherence protein B